MARLITAEEVSALLLADSLTRPQTATVTLGRRDSAWNPATTSPLIHGPARVTYRRHIDGGIDAQVDQ